jgi:starch synthase
VTSSFSGPGRVLFVNENLGGHATMHQAIREDLRNYPEIDAEFIDVPRPRLVRRIAGIQIPGLASLDCDLQPLRAQLALSAWVRGRLKRRGIREDVLHIYSENAALLSVREIRRRASVVSTDASARQSAFLVVYREPTRYTPIRAQLSSAFERRVYKAATLVVAKSEWAASSIRKDGGVDDDRLRVIPFGVVVPEIVARHEATSTPEITFIATEMKRKGGWRLLRIFRERLRDRCVLNLVTREAIQPEPGVRVYSDIRPNDGRLAQLLSGTAVLAFPSEMDTFGYAALEAMAIGVPVVGNRLHALPELVEDHVTGLLVDAHDDNEFAAALERLVDDPALRLRMGQAARARVLDHFDTRLTTKQLIGVLTEARLRHAELRGAPAFERRASA